MYATVYFLLHGKFNLLNHDVNLCYLRRISVEAVNEVKENSSPK